MLFFLKINCNPLTQRTFVIDIGQFSRIRNASIYGLPVFVAKTVWSNWYFFKTNFVIQPFVVFLLFHQKNNNLKIATCNDLDNNLQLEVLT